MNYCRSDSFERFKAPFGIEPGSDSVDKRETMPTNETIKFEAPLWAALTGAIDFGQSVSVSNMGTLAIMGGMGWSYNVPNRVHARGASLPAMA